MSKVLQAYNRAEHFEIQIKLELLERQLTAFKNFTCPICMEPMITYVNAQCKHYVCKPCFIKSIHSVNGNKCCICRAEIKLTHPY